MNRKAAIDFDILQYEIGYASEAYWRHLHKEKNQEVDVPPPWSIVEEALESRVSQILAVSESSGSPLMCITGQNNFRLGIAKTQKYKDRPGKKPYHYKNILAYAKCRWEMVEDERLEADDLLGILITEDKDIICCSRDKDLLQVQGWHYQWELNKQPQFGPKLVDGYGEIYLNSKGVLKGWGPKLFLAQCILGDPVDTIPGLPNKGPVAAMETLGHTTSYLEGLNAVREAYKASGKDDEYLLEQGQLLWIIREKNTDGGPVMWGIE